MSERKVVSRTRTIIITLAIICVILLVGLVGAIANYTSTMNSKDNTIRYQDSQIQTLTTEKNQLQSQINDLKAPKLILVNVKVDDNRPWLGTPYLHVYGEVANVGTNNAYNSKLHVVAYQGSAVAKDTYITLYTINGESWETVDSNIYYSGSAITSWAITPEWTG